MKFLLTILAAFLCAGAGATNIRIGPFTNSVGGFDTNQVALYQISGPIRAGGGYTTKGLPIIVSMTNNGIATNFLMPDNWFATNRFLGQGILFGGFPYDSGPTVYAMADWQISGGNTLVTRVITNGGAGSVTFNNVTNALGYTPPQGSVLTNFIFTNSINGTNFVWWTGMGLTNLIYTNSINISNAFLYESTALTNLVNTNGINVTNFTLLIGLGNTNLTLSTGLGLTNLIYTNGINGSNLTFRVGQNDTNFTLLTGLGLTNLVNTNSINLSNDVATASTGGTNFAMTLSNAVYRAGTNAPSSQSAFNATNGMQNGAFMDTNGFKVAMTNIANSVSGSGNFVLNFGGVSTNGYFTNVIAMSATNATIVKLATKDDVDFGQKNLTNVNYIFFSPGNSQSTIIAGSGSGDSFNIAAPHSAILMGENNKFLSVAPSDALILGGNNNVFRGNPASYAIIAGGLFNTNLGGQGAFIAAGVSNSVANQSSHSFVAGQQAQANHQDSFVWNDGSAGLFATTATNQVLFHSTNGFGINTNTPPVGGLGVSGPFNLNGQQIPQLNNLTNWYLVSTNAITNAAALYAQAATNALALGGVQQLGTATNISHFGFMSIGGGLTYIISTNVLGVTNCAYAPVNGTYNNYATAGAWTNIFDARWTLAFGAPNNYSFRSNGIIIYLGGSAFVGTNYAAQGTAVVPTPIVYIGGYVNPYGFIKNPTDVLQGTNDPNGIIIAPKGSHYQHFTGNRPDYILVNTNDLSGWY